MRCEILNRCFVFFKNKISHNNRTNYSYAEPTNEDLQGTITDIFVPWNAVPAMPGHFVRRNSVSGYRFHFAKKLPGNHIRLVQVPLSKVEIYHFIIALEAGIEIIDCFGGWNDNFFTWNPIKRQ